jgi:hypothetical protein
VRVNRRKQGMIRECCSFDKVSYMCTPIKESKMNILSTNTYKTAYIYNDSENQLVFNQHTQIYFLYIAKCYNANRNCLPSLPISRRRRGSTYTHYNIGLVLVVLLTDGLTSLILSGALLTDGVLLDLDQRHAPGVGVRLLHVLEGDGGHEAR